MTERRKLPDRRCGFTKAFDHGGLACTTTVNCYADGKPAEVFLRAGKPGSAADIAAHDGAVVASLALQHGVPLEVIRHALVRLPDGSAAGPLGRALDLIFHEHGDDHGPGGGAGHGLDLMDGGRR